MEGRAPVIHSPTFPPRAQRRARLPCDRRHARLRLYIHLHTSHCRPRGREEDGRRRETGPAKVTAPGGLRAREKRGSRKLLSGFSAPRPRALFRVPFGKDSTSRVPASAYTRTCVKWGRMTSCPPPVKNRIRPLRCCCVEMRRDFFYISELFRDDSSLKLFVC